MWIMLQGCFLSLVSKDCEPDELLVRARREGDIEKLWPDAKVTEYTKSDYLYRAAISKLDIALALAHEVNEIDYPNFKDSVEDEALHDAYTEVWFIMAGLQDPKPYSGLTGEKNDKN